jgi:hypothetical protein
VKSTSASAPCAKAGVERYSDTCPSVHRYRAFCSQTAYRSVSENKRCLKRSRGSLARILSFCAPFEIRLSKSSISRGLIFVRRSSVRARLRCLTVVSRQRSFPPPCRASSTERLFSSTHGKSRTLLNGKSRTLLIVLTRVVVASILNLLCSRQSHQTGRSAGRWHRRESR